jgi:membrane protein implicated in regulation of membrane protease activity
MKSMGPLLVVLGAVIIVLGVLAWSGLLSWFGRLPGDIRIDRSHTRIYVPITSMLILSVILSLLMMLFRRFR